MITETGENVQKVTFLDIETTGQIVGLHGITQIAAHMGHFTYDPFGFPVYHHYDSIDLKMAPFEEDEIDPAALEHIGVTYEEVVSRPDPVDQYERYVEWLGSYINKFDKYDKLTMISYWSHFDMDHLRQWFKNCGDTYFGSWFWCPPIDVSTMVQQRLIEDGMRGAMWNVQLGTVCDHFGIVRDGELHDAIVDCTILKNLYLHLRCHGCEQSS